MTSNFTDEDIVQVHRKWMFSPEACDKYLCTASILSSLLVIAHQNLKKPLRDHVSHVLSRHSGPQSGQSILLSHACLRDGPVNQTRWIKSRAWDSESHCWERDAGAAERSRKRPHAFLWSWATVPLLVNSFAAAWEEGLRVKQSSGKQSREMQRGILRFYLVPNTSLKPSVSLYFSFIESNNFLCAESISWKSKIFALTLFAPFVL